jgi:predicted acylesterase/phospholipase RssA
MSTAKPRIGLALSGGGFRATAFGLGALRALHDRDLLDNVTVVSGISGGSLLAAMWAYGPRNFDDFNRTVTELLTDGLQNELLRRALAPAQMLRAATSAAASALPRGVRGFSRTEALVSALQARGLDLPMDRVSHPGLETVISATDLATGNAVRFGSRVSSSSPYGRILEPITVAEAVAASAAFPLLLPALVRSYTFQRSDSTVHQRTVSMTDGGVYDNLGITSLLPHRSKAHTSHVHDIDYLIAVDAGRGRIERAPARNLISRLSQTLEISHGRVQDSGRNQLHNVRSANGLSGYAHIYLGVRDSRIPPLSDLVPRGAVESYPTNFAPVKTRSLQELTIRGEQVSRLLLAQHLPQLN